MIQEAFDISLYQRALPSVLEVKGAVADRIQRPPSGAIAVTTIQKVLLLDCCQQLRTGQLHQFIFERRDLHSTLPHCPNRLRHR
jgi:hypothetical protein